MERGGYLADRSLATVLFLALRMKRPLFLEGEAGVGKTEIAKVLAATLNRPPHASTMLSRVDEFRAVHNLNALSDICHSLGDRAESHTDPKRYLRYLDQPAA